MCLEETHQIPPVILHRKHAARRFHDAEGPVPPVEWASAAIASSGQCLEATDGGRPCARRQGVPLNQGGSSASSSANEKKLVKPSLAILSGRVVRCKNLCAVEGRRVMSFRGQTHWSWPFWIHLVWSFCQPITHRLQCWAALVGVLWQRTLVPRDATLLQHTQRC